MEAVACGGPPQEQILGRTCSPWREAHIGAGDLAGAAARGGPRLEQCAPDGWTRGIDPYLEQFLKSCCLLAMPHQFSKDCIPWEGPHVGAKEESDREGTSETKHYRLTTTLTPLFPCTAQGEEVGEGGWREGIFGFFPLFLTSLACY